MTLPSGSLADILMNYGLVGALFTYLLYYQTNTFAKKIDRLSEAIEKLNSKIDFLLGKQNGRGGVE